MSLISRKPSQGIHYRQIYPAPVATREARWDVEGDQSHNQRHISEGSKHIDLRE